jgi:hypothetical protein
MRIILIAVLISLSNLFVSGQQNILSKPDILETVEMCLYATYGYNFEEAHALQIKLENDLPYHPAPYFLKALIIYWENFPLLPKTPKVADFVSEMDKTIDLSQLMINTKDGDMEGIFFDMHARAFKGMFWADNGKVSKVILDLDNMYRNTMKGIEYKEKFNEFYFSSALYNYYIEAYIEKHPVYKPIVRLFRKGDKKLGLKELEYAIDSTTYIKYEALLFMSLIQLNYEHNFSSAIDYMAVLYNNFPKNIYYFGQYLIILLHKKNYIVASNLNSKLADHPNEFHQMIYSMTEGFLIENQQNNHSIAKEFYLETIELAKNFGNIADLYAAIAYAGLSRIAKYENGDRSARRYRRISSRLSVYDFILDF